MNIAIYPRNVKHIFVRIYLRRVLFFSTAVDFFSSLATTERVASLLWRNYYVCVQNYRKKNNNNNY